MAPPIGCAVIGAVSCVEAVKPQLVAKLEKHEPGEDGEYGIDGPYYTLDYDYVLISAREKAAT